MLRMRLRQRGGHVEVGHAGLEAGVEDLRVEPRVGGVEDGVRLHVPDQGDDRVLARRVDLGGVEAVVLAEPVDDGLRPGRIEVGEGDPIEERPALGDCGEGGADAACSDDEDSHAAGST